MRLRSTCDGVMVTGDDEHSPIVLDELEQKVLMVVDAEAAYGNKIRPATENMDRASEHQYRKLPTKSTLSDVQQASQPTLSEQPVLEPSSTTTSSLMLPPHSSTVLLFLQPSSMVQSATPPPVEPPQISLPSQQRRTPSVTQRRRTRPATLRRRRPAATRVYERTMLDIASDMLETQKMMLEELQKNTAVQVNVVIAIQELNNRLNQCE